MIRYNKKQLECITYPASPLMIIAGAGTGKTATIIGRICHLIEERRTDPSNILALTFTVKAAENLKRSIVEIVGEKGKKVYACNFHSFALDMLLENYEKLGYKTKPTVIEANESKYLLNQLINKNSSIFTSTEYKKRNPRALEQIHKIFNQISDELISLDSLEKEVEALNENKNKNELQCQLLDAINLFFIYRKIKKDNSWVDFGDMIFNLSDLLDDDKILSNTRILFRHLIVDEFQDNNYALSRILEKLSGKGGSITIVGDDDQSIYSFRGAHISGFNEFREFHSGSNEYAEITLDINYRSTQSILDFANETVKNNDFRLKDIPLRSNTDLNDDVVLYSGDRISQISMLINLISKSINNGISPSKICVLTRSRGNAVELIDYLQDNDISVLSISEKLFETNTAKDFISFINIIYKGEYIGIGFYRLLQNSNYDKILNNPGVIPKIIAFYNNNLSNENLSKLENFNFDIVNFLLTINNKEILNNSIIDLFIEFSSKFLKNNPDHQILNEFQKLIDKHIISYTISENSDICSYLNALFDSNDTYIETNQEDREKVSVMTVHQSKGLEFDVVLIPFLTSSVFPASNKKSQFLDSLPEDIINRNILDSNSNIEEERRIFHVAVTRAKKNIFLFAPKERRSKFFKNIDSTTYTEIIIDDIPSLHTKTPNFEYKYIKPASFSFSSSSLDLYEKCPLSYKYNFMDRVKLSKYSPESLVGIFLHKALENIYIEKNKDISYIEKVIDNCWREESFYDSCQSNEFKSEAKKILIDYINHNQLDLDLDSYPEYELEVEIDADKFRGKLDRLDINKSNLVSIVDYKTSKKKKTLNRAQKDLQLLYYSFLYMKKMNKDISNFSIRSKLVYIRDFENPEVEVEFTLDDLKQLEERIKNIAKEIKAYNFQPRKNSICYFCQYKRLLCPLYK